MRVTGEKPGTGGVASKHFTYKVATDTGGEVLILETQPPANSGGWQDWNVDLSSFAGKQVELSISYVSDWGTQGLGVFLDDAKVTVDGATTAETSFETDLGGWTVSGPAAGFIRRSMKHLLG